MLMVMANYGKRYRSGLDENGHPPDNSIDTYRAGTFIKLNRQMVKWGQLYESAKDELQKILDNPEAEDRDKVNACKLVLDTLREINPVVLTEKAEAIDSKELAASAVLGYLEAQVIDGVGVNVDTPQPVVVSGGGLPPIVGGIPPIVVVEDDLLPVVVVDGEVQLGVVGAGGRPPQPVVVGPGKGNRNPRCEVCQLRHGPGRCKG